MYRRLATKPAGILLAVALACSAGCGRDGARPSDRLVLCASYPVYVSTLNITAGIGGVRVGQLSGGHHGCPHDHHPDAGDMKQLAEARVLIVNGAGLEARLAGMLARYPHLPVIDASRGFPIAVGPDGATNAHVWVAPSGAMHQVRTISEGLAALDPQNAARYRTNAGAYLGKLAALRTRTATDLAGLRHRPFLTFHDAFHYYAGEFGLAAAGTIQREAESVPGAATLAAAVQTARRSGARVIFSEPHAPRAAVDTVARETGLPVRELDPAASGPEDPDAYLAAMERNRAVLVDALR